MVNVMSTVILERISGGLGYLKTPPLTPKALEEESKIPRHPKQKYLLVENFRHTSIQCYGHGGFLCVDSK